MESVDGLSAKPVREVEGPGSGEFLRLDGERGCTALSAGRLGCGFMTLGTPGTGLAVAGSASDPGGGPAGSVMACDPGEGGASRGSVAWVGGTDSDSGAGGRDAVVEAAV